MRRIFYVFIFYLLLCGNCFAGMASFLPAIKSIQHVTITITYGSNYGDTTISSVNLSYYAIQLDGVEYGAGSQQIGVGYCLTDDDRLVRLALTSATNIRAYLGPGGTAGDTITVRATITEFYSYAVKRCEQHAASLLYNETYDLDTFTAVNLSKTLFYFAGVYSNISTSLSCVGSTVIPINNFYPSFSAYSTTQVRLYRGYSYVSDVGTWSYTYFLVELQPWVSP